MRPDLQELEITLGELKRLTGLKCFLGKSWRLSTMGKKIHIGVPYKFILDGYFLIFLLFMIVSIIYINSLNLFEGIIVAFLGIFVFFFLGKYYSYIFRSSAFAREVNEYYQLILNINTLDELEAVGNPVKLSEREKVLEALRINRENLVRALQTERILRENPQFRPEQFNVDLSGLRSLQATEKATEYGRFLDEALQIGVSVQTEMRKLENKHLGL